MQWTACLPLISTSQFETCNLKLKILTIFYLFQVQMVRQKTKIKKDNWTASESEKERDRKRERDYRRSMIINCDTTVRLRKSFLWV